MHSVLIIDDHDIVRFGLEALARSCPDLELVGSASSLEGGLAVIGRTRPDLVISDMGLGDSNGLGTVRALVQAQAGRKVLIVSMQDEMLYGEQALALGANGYLMKESAHANVIPAALSVLAGETWAAPRLQSLLVQRLLRRGSGTLAEVQADPAMLTERELQVLQLLKPGKTTKEIAVTLGLSIRTVDLHRAHIKKKLGLRTGAELIAYASSRL